MSIYPYCQNYVPNEPVCAASVATPDLSVCDSAKVKLYGLPQVAPPSANDVLLFQPNGSSSFVSAASLAQFTTQAGAVRPAAPYSGQMFFDTTLGTGANGKPIWWSVSLGAWVDATGAGVPP
jgi:hypothetical protein